MVKRHIRESGIEEDMKSCNRGVSLERAETRSAGLKLRTIRHGKGGDLGKFNQPASQEAANSTVGRIDFKLFYRRSKYIEKVTSCLHVVIGEFEGSHIRVWHRIRRRMEAARSYYKCTKGG